MEGTKKTIEEREELLIDTEELMHQGVQNASFIARELKISVPTAQEYQKAILKRWELIGKDGSETFAKMKVEQIEKSRYVEFELWGKVRSSTNESAALGIIRTIMELHKYQAYLAGIPKVMDNTKN